MAGSFLHPYPMALSAPVPGSPLSHSLQGKCRVKSPALNVMMPPVDTCRALGSIRRALELATAGSKMSNIIIQYLLGIKEKQNYYSV